MRTNRAQDNNIALNRNDCKGKPAGERECERVEAGEEERYLRYLTTKWEYRHLFYGVLKECLRDLLASFHSLRLLLFWLVFNAAAAVNDDDDDDDVDDTDAADGKWWWWPSDKTTTWILNVAFACLISFHCLVISI